MRLPFGDQSRRWTTFATSTTVTPGGSDWLAVARLAVAAGAGDAVLVALEVTGLSGAVRDA
jgi:hypothetical protein